MYCLFIGEVSLLKQFLWLYFFLYLFTHNIRHIHKIQYGKIGVRVSEQPFGELPDSRNVTARSNMLAAFGLACVVVEASFKSSTMAAARQATEFGRDVLAVPGHPFDVRSAGCNALIRDGATLIRGAQDVIEALRPLAPTPALDKLVAGVALDQRLSDIASSYKSSRRPPLYSAL